MWGESHSRNLDIHIKYVPYQVGCGNYLTLRNATWIIEAFYANRKKATVL